MNGHDTKSAFGCRESDNNKPPSIVMHGSAVNTKKGALAFLGQSGAGKSSIVELLTSHSDYQFIADDLIALSYTDNCWQIKNGVHHLSDSIANNPMRNYNGTPVVGFMVLHQARQASSTRMAQSEFAIRLMNAILEVVGHSTGYDAYKSLRWFSYIGLIAESTPCWHLTFPLSKHTIDHLSSIVSTI